MKIRKILKFMLLLIAVGLLLFCWKIIVSEVVSTNLKLSQGNLWILTIIYWIELLFILLIYDLVIIKIFSNISYWLKKLGQSAIRKGKIWVILCLIRLDYYLLRLRRLLRLGWVPYGIGSENPVLRGLSKQRLVKFVKLIVNAPMILAFLFACFTLGILSGDISNYLSKVQEFLRDIIQIKVNIGDIFSRLPSLVALVTILPIIFSFYFYSQKRDVRKIIDKENSQYFEEVVLLYEKLLSWIDDHIYQLSKNFEYVITWQDSIVETILQKEVPNYKELVGNRSYSVGDIETFSFDDTVELTELREIITKLLSDRLIKYTRILSVKRFDIWNLYICDFCKLKEESMEESFYTKNGMISEFNKHDTYAYDFTKEQIEKRREEFAFRLSWYLYEDLERLYRLKRASDSLRKYLYSSQMERLILRALNKDK